jgi:ubiquinone/menaquinone biosynthesis C-methylase UbiE
MAQQISFETYRGSAAENYDRYFVPAIGAPLAADLIDLAELRTGERVVDVACGTGVVTRLAASQVGAKGVVVGVDGNPEMLAVARTAADDSTIDWYEASADALPLSDGVFDIAFCQLGLQFFRDRAIALREMRRVLADGGRVLVNLPGPTPSVFTVLDEALARHVGPEASRFVRAVFSLHDPGEVAELLTGAGFDAVDIRSSVKTLRLPAPERFLWQYVHSTPLEAATARLDQERRVALERDVVAGWEPYTDDGRLLLDLNVTVANAR